MINKFFNVVPDTAVNGLDALQQFQKRYETVNAKADSSEEGEHKCDFNRYRLIFMDLNMPEMDGFTSCQKILEFQRDVILKKDPDHPKCEIVALTAFVDQ